MSEEAIAAVKGNKKLISDLNDVISELIERIKDNHDTLGLIRERLQKEWNDLGDKLDQIEDEGGEESMDYMLTLGRRGMVHTVQEWMGDK
jgi:uncharacterized coiled-coil protein SlyX